MTVCPHRQSFSICSTATEYKLEVLSSIDWGHFPHLRFIQIEVFPGKSAPKEVLSQIVSVHMQEVAFIYALKEEDGLDGDLWFELDAILARPQFSGLRRVSISSSLSSPYSISDHKWFVRHLPQCHARGILVITDGEENASLFDSF